MADLFHRYPDPIDIVPAEVSYLATRHCFLELPFCTITRADAVI
jgi:hypothetical protein